MNVTESNIQGKAVTITKNVGNHCSVKASASVSQVFSHTWSFHGHGQPCPEVAGAEKSVVYKPCPLLIQVNSLRNQYMHAFAFP